MHRLEYHRGRIIEIVLPCSPKAVCKWKANILKQSTHKLGVFKIVKL